MAGIFTRKAISAILNDEGLTPEERTDQLFSLYGRAIDDGYITKSAAQAAQESAVEKAKADALKDFKAPDAKESAEYKALQQEFDTYKQMQTARTSEDFSEVKPKFFDTVYGMLDHADGAKPVKDQLAEIHEKYEEYFTTVKEAEPVGKPNFGAETKGSAPTGKTGASFMDTWGFAPKKD